MDWEFIAPMLVGIVFIITMGGVLLLRPVAKRAGALLEAMAQERTARLTAAARPPQEVDRLRDEVETLQARLEQLEARQDFTEGLMGPEGSRTRRQLTGQSTEPAG